MKNSDCVQFLQRLLPRMQMRWAGFRKIRGRVCKRIQRRLNELNLESVGAYYDYLETHPDEWQVLDKLCWVSISRFYRDKMVFIFLEQDLLPELARQVLASGKKRLSVWSAGCASGEEPYTVALMWDLSLKSRFPELDLHIMGTDSDSNVLQRAEQGCYPFSSIGNLPQAWRETCFIESANAFLLKSRYKSMVNFSCHDIRNGMPEGPFHLILCRNLVFTYFDQDLQLSILKQMTGKLSRGGAFVVGIHEVLPEGNYPLEEWSRRLGIYRKY